MKTVYNFSAGPAMLPSSVMQRAQREFLNFAGTGMSAMEISHRSAEFTAIMHHTESDLRELLSVPDNYKILFTQAGATGQFAMVPLNLLRDKKKADYLLTGHWGKKAVAEAKRFCEVNLAADGSADNFTDIPAPETWALDKDAAYVHYTPNETIAGVEFHSVPEVGNIPLVADMSSNILSCPIDVSKFGVIYAGAQKNIGPAGLNIVIVREDLVGHAPDNIPSLFDYASYADNNSMPNTPPTFAIYMAGLVFDWVKRKGGVEGMAAQNKRKAKILYGVIDSSDFYRSPVAPADRSFMNIPFMLADDNLDNLFLREAKAEGLTNLTGHRSVGGMRASIYNAMPDAGVAALVDFMCEFEERHG